MATLLEKVKIYVCDILADRLVDDSWGIVLKIIVKVVGKKYFCEKNIGATLKNSIFFVL